VRQRSSRTGKARYVWRTNIVWLLHVSALSTAPVAAYPRRQRLSHWWSCETTSRKTQTVPSVCRLRQRPPSRPRLQRLSSEIHFRIKTRPVNACGSTLASRPFSADSGSVTPLSANRVSQYCYKVSFGFARLRQKKSAPEADFCSKRFLHQ
jgi:hypothetical protein